MVEVRWYCYFVLFIGLSSLKARLIPIHFHSPEQLIEGFRIPMVYGIIYGFHDVMDSVYFVVLLKFRNRSNIDIYNIY
jgi:hypothetical protein